MRRQLTPYRRDRIAPGEAPGGIVCRVCRYDGTVVWWEAADGIDLDLGRVGLALLASRHAQVALDNSAPGAPAYVHVFDGDTGQCLATFVTMVDR